MTPMNLLTDRGLLAAAEYARAHDEDPEHAEQVCRLAVMLFDATQDIHGLSLSDKRILVAAALLHDLGWTTRPDAHHKGSRDIILAAPLPGLDGETVRMVACVARYHRKAHPNTKHKLFRDLNAESQERVRKLAALLRIADGLDRTHAATIKGLEVRQQGTTLHVVVAQEPGSAIDIMGAERKKGLFEELFGTKVIIEVRRNSV